MALAIAAGFTPMIAPALVKPEAMEGTGFLGGTRRTSTGWPTRTSTSSARPRSRWPAYHSGEILDAVALPLRYAGFSSCFRREAGSYGKDTRGIIRVHWFDKVEMFSYAQPDDAVRRAPRLLAWEQEFIDKLELAYRVIDVAAGRPRLVGVAQVRHRGVVPVAGRLPRADVHVELHHVPGPTAEHPLRDDDGRPPGRHPQRDARARSRARSSRLLDHHQQPDGSVYVPVGAAALSRRP